MNTKKRVGPRILTWGTPDKTGFSFGTNPSRTTCMDVDKESQQTPQIADHQLHMLSVYKEVSSAIHDQRLLRCQRRKGEYRAPEKGAQPTILIICNIKY